MATFPGAIPSYAGFNSSDTLAADNHASQHNSEQADISAIATKVGTGSSTPTSAKLLRGNGSGTSAWAQADLTSDVTGVLPQANGGTGQTGATGTGVPVYQTSPTISGAALTASPTITTPTIGSFVNANHDHTNSAGGGVLGTNALSNASVTASKLSTGAQVNTVATIETTASTSYTDLATSGASVTATIGANGLALLIITCRGSNDTAAAYSIISYVASGANTIAANDVTSLILRNSSGAPDIQASWSILLTGLTAGSTTFKLQYRVSAGTGTFQNRSISVIPL